MREPKQRRRRAASSPAGTRREQATVGAGSHQTAVDAFLRALQRDVAWNFFYGLVNFDTIFGTFNHYGTVDMFMGRFNEAFRGAKADYNETFSSDVLMKGFRAMLDDWTNEGFDPFAAPTETGSAFGRKRGQNRAAVSRERVAAKRVVGLPGDAGRRSDANGFPVNRHFADVPQEEPDIQIEPGFEGEVAALLGGRPPDDPALSAGCYVLPTVVRARPEDRVCREEVFGPFVTLTTFRGEDEAVEIANGTDYGLGAGLWTRDLSRAHRVAGALQAGMVWVNSYKRVNPGSPFGGVRGSGYGREMGFEAMDEYTFAKSVWINHSAQIPAWYPR